MSRLDNVRRSVAVADVYAMSRATGAREFLYATRAGAYVWIAAALEDFWKLFIGATIDEINGAAEPANKLRPSLLCLANASRFQSLHSRRHPRDLAKWSFEIDVLESVVSTDIAFLSTHEKHWPLDGSTLTRQQLEMIWAVFGFRTPVLPSRRTQGFLTDLLENRTRAAHGHEEPSRLGRQKSTHDTFAMIAQAEDLIAHALDTATSYVLGREFRR